MTDEQKTAYEMFNRDWSSDVCSSDLDASWQALDTDVVATIEKACAFADASPFPKPEDALEDMYAL